VHEGIYRAREESGFTAVQHLATIMTGVFIGQYQWEGAKALIHAYIDSTEDPVGQRIWSCGKNMDDTANEMDPMTDETVGWLAIFGSCAWGAAE
jgi:hypothetical protein